MPPRVVLLALDLGRLPCRNDTDDVVVCAVGMDDDQHSKGGAQAEQNEPLFIPGVVGIVEEASVLVSKGSWLPRRRSYACADSRRPSDGPTRTGAPPWTNVCTMYVRRQVWVAQPNGSGLSCGRLARWRKSVER